jgi:hypothetical protein
MMAYGNTGFGPGYQRALANPTIARVPDPGLVAERQRLKNFMSDMAHVTPTGELVTYAPEPFGDKVRMLKKDLDDGGQAASQASTHNRGMAAILLEDQRRRQGLPG